VSRNTDIKDRPRTACLQYSFPVLVPRVQISGGGFCSSRVVLVGSGHCTWWVGSKDYLFHTFIHHCVEPQRTFVQDGDVLAVSLQSEP
jgi:hypothetical protein